MKHNARLFCIAAALLVVLAACGDDDGTATTTPDSGATATTETGEATASTGAVSPFGVTGTTAEVCGRLLTMAEVEALFGEPAELDENLSDGWNPSLGSIVCSWNTIENPDNTDDLAVETLIAQVYLGDPIDGANFYAPDATYEDVTHFAGIGDDAYVTGPAGHNTGFLDGSIAGFVTYASIDFGGDAVEATQDDVTALLRLVHDRVT